MWGALHLLQDLTMVQANFLSAAQHYFAGLDISHHVLVKQDIAELELPTSIPEFKNFENAHMDETSQYLHAEYIMKVVSSLNPKP